MRSTHSSFRGALRAVVIGVMLAAATMAGTALAAEQGTDKIGPHTHQLHGTVDATPAAAATSFTLDTERYGKVTVSFTTGTVRGLGHPRGQARSYEVSKVTELKQGDRVVVQGRANTNGTFTARRVYVLARKHASGHAIHLVGTVSGFATANGTATLTVKLADGSSQSVTVSSATKIRPEGKTVADLTAGAKITVVARNGAATGILVRPA